MATPKKKISRSRRNMRRFAAGNALEKTTTTTCPACSDLKRPHRVCACGHYDGKAVLPSKKAEIQA
ncbi:MAG: 50S ribosomal protein L32 [Oligoflexia bacterium]|nr:50S ribosomal protein L32 [Oligoflexia bacterium]